MFIKKKQVLPKEIQERVKKHRGQKYLSLLLQILQFRKELVYHSRMLTKTMPW